MNLDPIFAFIETHIFQDWRFFFNQYLNVLPFWLIGLFGFILSACIGSFINVVVYRLPIIFERNLLAFLAEMKDYKAQADININIDEQFDTQNIDKNIDENIAEDFENLEENNISAALQPPTFNLSQPKSNCPICKTPIKWYDNIPLFSWLILKGKCRACGTSISAQYFLVELLTAFLGAAITYFYFYQWQSTPISTSNSFLNTFALNAPFYGVDFISLLFLLVFLWQLITIALLDAKTQLMPNELTLPFIITGLLFACYQQYYDIRWFYQINAMESVVSALLAFMGLSLFSKAFTRIRKVEGLGEGDVYLFAGFAAWFGLMIAFYAVFIAAALGLVYLITAAVLGKRDFSQSIAFGPFLSIGLLVILVSKYI